MKFCLVDEVYQDHEYIPQFRKAASRGRRSTSVVIETEVPKLVSTTPCVPFDKS